MSKLQEHLTWMRGNGELTRRRTRRARDEIETIAVTAMRSRFADVHGDQRLDDLATRVITGRCDPYAAADVLMKSLGRTTT
ncbi:MAG: hypothetical protein H0V23_00540 [Nocardioidaceae bacterium]|nr:hypothetical protein [Nocardioidaceae bacterium]